jgi:hypothetical protein
VLDEFVDISSLHWFAACEDYQGQVLLPGRGCEIRDGFKYFFALRGCQLFVIFGWACVRTAVGAIKLTSAGDFESYNTRPFTVHSLFLIVRDPPALSRVQSYEQQRHCSTPLPAGQG